MPVKHLKYLPDGRKKPVLIPYFDGRPAVIDAPPIDINHVLAAMSHMLYKMRNKIDRLELRIKELENVSKT